MLFFIHTLRLCNIYNTLWELTHRWFGRLDPQCTRGFGVRPSPFLPCQHLALCLWLIPCLKSESTYYRLEKKETYYFGCFCWYMRYCSKYLLQSHSLWIKRKWCELFIYKLFNFLCPFHIVGSRGCQRRHKRRPRTGKEFLFIILAGIIVWIIENLFTCIA